MAIAVFGIVMLHVFKGQLNRKLTESNLPFSVGHSVQVPSNKLAAITVPNAMDATTQQLLHHTIDESFVSGFRAVMAGGAVLAIAGALTALALIRTSNRT
ncbi:MAG: hypothetical protein JO314_00480 [Acidobacteria bacterium]|nr:hypothetical protein [Acidobacteriota bacterium]